MKYEALETIIKSDGLRIVLVQGFPSPWGQAAKAMIEYKGLLYRVAPQLAGEDNTELLEWSGVNSGPVVAWDALAPINRWEDILFLLERLAPRNGLLPESQKDRAHCLGLSHIICGELGLGWNRRLSMFKPILDSGEAPTGVQNMADKYGYNSEDVAKADRRVCKTLEMLADILRKQNHDGSRFFIGEQVTAVDFYWTAFSNLCSIMPAEICPLDSTIRPMFENVSEEVRSAIDPVLIEHRDFIMKEYFKVPMEL
jgi:glutathione S-transferase